ncbi:uncharacterized protein LOC117330095 [Pecten maximus]|uniref:uncharacterized protein LOC117330095 n=1 Tax=Pecten maximus TaxID=6579 RepID=UPI001458AE89|nr:uncharacterized protein LOC117330095 [Pecten maximus]
MNAILLFAVAMFGALPLCTGHLIYRRTKYLSPVIHKRTIIMPPRIYIHRYPTYTIQKNMGTVYPTRGHGPFYRPNFPANINTFHPQATVTPNFVVPSKGHVVNTGFITPINGGMVNNVNEGFVNPGFVVPRDLPPMDFNKNVIIQGLTSFPGDNVPFPVAETGIGFNTKNVDADGKPVVQEQNKNGDQAQTPDSSSLGGTSGIEGGLPVISPVVVTETGNGAGSPVITPVVITDASDAVSEPLTTGLPELTFPDVGLPDTNQIFPGVGGEKQNSRCHKTGCDTGAECVFAEEYICPSYIPSVECECRLGCRLDNTFIPLGGSITIDVCGNTCSCNNMYGAAECTQRMCKPEDPTVSIAGTVSSDSDIGGFQGAFDSIPSTKPDSGAFDFPASSSNRVTVPELQQFTEPMQVVEKIVKESSLAESVQDGLVTTESSIPQVELNNAIGLSNPDVTTSPSEPSTESPLV